MGPTWVLSAPDGPHVGPMNLAIRECARSVLNFDFIEKATNQQGSSWLNHLRSHARMSYNNNDDIIGSYHCLISRPRPHQIEEKKNEWPHLISELWKSIRAVFPNTNWDISAGVMLTHWDRERMVAISQTSFSNAFSWMKIYEFRLKFHWSLFPRVQLTIFQHWFSEPMMVRLPTHICVTQPQWVLMWSRRYL